MSKCIMFVLVLAGGFGLGLLVGLSRGRDAARAPDGGEQSIGVSPAEAPPPTIGRPVPVAPSALPRLSEAIAAVEIPKVAEGEGVLAGRVRSESGEPLPGVLVYAIRIRTGDARAADRWKTDLTPEPIRIEEPDFRTRIMAFIEEERRREAARREATTDGAGSFEITGLADAPYRISGRKEGYEIQPIETTPETEVALAAIPLVAVPIFVLLPDGSEADEAAIHWKKPTDVWSEETKSPWSPRTAILQFRPGVYKLRATRGHAEDLSSDVEDLTAEAGTAAEKIVFQLRENPGIKGKVVFPEGEEQRWVFVYALPWEEAGTPTEEDFRESALREIAARDEAYAFAFKDLSPGTYALGAGDSEGGLFDSKTVQVSDRMLSVVFVHPPLARSDYAVLRAFGPDGRVLSDLSIETRYSWRLGSKGGGVEIRRPDGSFWLTFLPESEEEADGEYHATVTSERYGEQEVRFPRSVASDVTVRFEEPARIEVTIAGFAARSKEGIELNVVPAGKGSGWAPMALSERRSPDAEGRQVFGPLKTGAHEIVVSFRVQRGAHHYECRGASTPVTLVPGMNRAAVTAPELHPLTVMVDGDDREGWIFISPTSERDACWSDDSRIDEQGMATFQDLLAGEYVLSRFRKGAPDGMVVTVPCRDTVPFVPRPVDALRVTVEDEKGHLSAAGLLTGDLIVEMGGQPLTGIDPTFQVPALSWMFRAEPEVGVVVLRGKDRIETRLETARFKSEGLLGGELEPAARP